MAVPASLILDQHGVPIRMGSAVSSASAYRAASTQGQDVAGWLPPGLSADAAILRDRRLTADRVEDLHRNNSVAVAATMRLVDMLVGSGLRFSSKPRADALGLSREDARALGIQIEREFARHANDPRKRMDAQRKLSGNGQFRLMARSFVKQGEACLVSTWREGQGPYATAFQAIDPARLANPVGRRDDDTLRGGVEIDTYGAPVAYHVSNRHPGGVGFGVTHFERVPKETDWGRPVFLHVFEPDREDQNRAITPFAPLMGRMRMLDRWSDHEIAAAAVNSLYAAFVKSSLPFGEVMAAMDPQAALQTAGGYDAQRLGYYQDSPLKIGGVRIPVMPVGDEIVFNGTPRQSAAFGEFNTAFLQQIAAARGLSYEQLSMDFTKSNYSSARAALNETWRMVKRLLAQFVEQGPQQVLLCVIEEAIDKGYVTPPKGCVGLWDDPAAWLAGRWIGPGRGWVDPVKEAESASLRMETMVSTLEVECAEQGLEFEEVLDQIQREEEMMASRKLTRATVAGRIAARATASEPAAEAPALA